MRQKLILNDIHLGVQRSAGTTPKTAAALKAYLVEQLRKMLFQHLDKDIIINGDIFDQFNVPLADVFEFMTLCREWLTASGGSLTLAEGNHDLSKNSVNMCSLAFVAAALNSESVNLVENTSYFQDSGILVIPHVANQDMFDMEIEKASLLSDTLILVHANYDNEYAVQSDHSLNVSYQQCKSLVANNNTLLFGHVHQQSKPQKGVVVAGNQWPSSVADCIGNDNKIAHIFDPATRSLTTTETWNAAESFAQIAWDELDKAKNFEFVRVIGDCPTKSAADMLATISRYRQRSDSFVVTNAVKVAGVVDMEDLPSNLESVKGFDVLGYLFENLDAQQVAVVKGLMEKNNA